MVSAEMYPELAEPAEVVIGTAKLNTRSRVITSSTLTASLTPKESAVLRALAGADGRVCSKAYLMDHIYGLETADIEPGWKIIDVFICRLRSKLERFPFEIKTSRGRGYYLEFADGSGPVDTGNAWIQTWSGKKFDLIDPKISDFDIKDIAHALSKICRFAGHTQRFYSVAEHCVHVAEWVEKQDPDADKTLVRTALLHDAAEAYMCDLPRPLKGLLPGYKKQETHIEYYIAEAFNTYVPLKFGAIEEADNRILFDERAQAMGPCDHKWEFEHEPLGITLRFWPPGQAVARFLKTYDRVAACAGT